MKNILSDLKNKKIIGYGAGLAALTTLRGSKLVPEFFIDDTIKNLNQELNGIKIFSFDKLKQIKIKNYHIIIFAYNPHTINKILKKIAPLGFTFDENVFDCSLIHHRKYSRDFFSTLV